MKDLETVRQTIDSIDTEIVALIGKRMSVSQEIGKIKQQTDQAVHQPNRWQEVLHHVTTEGETYGLTPEFVTELYNLIHEESKKKQRV